MLPATSEHKNRKRAEYWADLVGGGTAAYKSTVLAGLLEQYPPCRGGQILDVGCGTSNASTSFCRFVPGAREIRCDYDAGIVAGAATGCTNPAVEFRVADIFDLEAWDDRFSLVLFLDVLHEVYSFVGRGPDARSLISHGPGVDAVRRAVASVSRLVLPGGAIAITDDVLPPANGQVRIRVHDGALRAVRRFLGEYPSRRIPVRWAAPDELELGAHDLCVLLTQYNKIKRGDEDRWAVEQLELHQYMTAADYRSMFDDLGFDAHCIVGTPPEAHDEWHSDFQVLSGLRALPDKRITLLAVRR